ncbi:cytochrome P450 71B10-like [Papaver somniferum]|uniref:cytochrome P450 71B10-like n=1 Tax=Papaver somniferum TaxID=3469 RepID=UPI000E6FD6B1|nr:cytochrome P450 71B10-like [Papaver somniferum]
MELSSWIPYLSILLPLLIFPFYLLRVASKPKDPDRLKFPPSPCKLPIIGNFHQLGETPHRSLWELSKKFGPVMLLHLGSVPTLVISSAEAAEEVLRTNDLEFCSRPRSVGPKRLSYNFLDIAFAPYGEYWREIRKVCVHELFSAKRVQSFGALRAQEVAAMIHSISESTISVTPVDIVQKTLSLTDQIICKVAFGMSYELGSGRFQEIVYEAIDMLGGFTATDFFPGVGWIIDRLTGMHGRLEKSFHDLDTFYQKIIDEHLDPQRMISGHEDIIDVLLKLEKDRRSSIRLTKDHIKAVLMNLFLAGVETTAVTIGWAMAELIRNPASMKKVQEEIRSYAGNKGKVEEVELDHLQYHKMVVKETLRLHPPLPLLIPRESIQQSKINGYDVLPETRVYVNVYAIVRNPKYWEKPDEFFPERFKDSSIDIRRQSFDFLPFGAGRRVCPGISMGLATVELALANLLYSFDWELPNGMSKEDVKMDESSGLTVHQKSALHLVPIKHI